ncbi:MAG TPA: methyltransferase domain-containing protein [Candidatus Acidoferrales bacterium]|nr:methyltransferase domain-containing protein [Candidatus Acidoferrales bacterium]
MEREARLRERLVSRLEAADTLRRQSVAAAMRTVPRHRFLPGVSIDEAYADRAIAIKAEGGEVTASVSQPGMIAQMLELLQAERGDRILEIGTGSGYNAALLGDIVGPQGSVTTIDLDDELAERARATLDAVGCRNVRVLAADGAQPQAAQFDRLIVTARSDDIAAAWWNAVRNAGRMVVPLRLESAGEYAVGFDLSGKRLISVGAWPCAFVAMRGTIAAPATTELFYRDPAERGKTAHVRRIANVVAVRREDATPSLLNEADVVVARPVTFFGVTFRPS